MWNSPAAQNTPPNVASNPASPQNSIWSPEQLVRLEYEWSRLQRSYAYHPAVRVQPVQGDPPAEYLIDYRVRTLIIDEAGQLTYADHCQVHLRLGPDFPHGPPAVRPLSAVFHPNAAADTMQIIPAWQPNHTLIDVVQRIGALLAFQSYDPYSVWNPVAMQWVSENSGYVPTDPEANLLPDAGGDPLSRICRYGEQTLKEIQKSLQDKCALLLETKGAPSVAEIQSYAQRTRMTLGPFTAPDVPASLSNPANQLDQWTSDLPHAAPVFESLRKLKAATSAALIAAAELEDAQKAVAQKLANLDAMVTDPISDDPHQALLQLPPLMDLQAIHAQVRANQTKAAQRLIAARQRLEPLQPPAQPGTPFVPPLQSAIDAEITRQTAAVGSARERLSKMIALATPVLDRAKLELDALEKLLGWREYSELRTKADDLVEQVRQWGSAAPQAYFVGNESGEFGPFEFEQKLELGAAPLIIRHIGRTGLEAVDVKSGLRMGRNDSGELRSAIAGEAPGESYPTTFRLTARCDDLAVQLDYLLRQTHGLISRLAGVAPAAPSWCGKFLAALAAPAGWAKLKTDFEAAAGMYGGVAEDLVALAPYKERLATFFLLERLDEAVPRWQKEHVEMTALHERHGTRIAEILARSGKDLENNRPIIPAKLEKDYKEATEKHEQSHRDLVRLEKLQDISANQIKSRTESRTMFGKGHAPATPKILAPLPPELTEITEAVSDEAIAARVTNLGTLLHVEFALPHLRKTQPESTPAAEPVVAEATTPVPPPVPAPDEPLDLDELEEVLHHEDGHAPPALVDPEGETEFAAPAISAAYAEEEAPEETYVEEEYAAETADGFFIHDEPQEPAAESDEAAAEETGDVFSDWPAPDPTPPPPPKRAGK